MLARALMDLEAAVASEDPKTALELVACSLAEFAGIPWRRRKTSIRRAQKKVNAEARSTIPARKPVGQHMLGAEVMVSRVAALVPDQRAFHCWRHRAAVTERGCARMWQGANTASGARRFGNQDDGSAPGTLKNLQDDVCRGCPVGRIQSQKES